MIHSTKMTVFDHLGAMDDLTIRISNLFDEMRQSRSLRPLRLLRLLRSLRLLRFEGVKNHNRGLQSHPRSWIQIYFDVLKKYFFGVESWNINLNFGTFSVRGCWGQKMLLSWKVVVVPKNSLSQHSRAIFKPSLIFIHQSQFIKSNSNWDTL